MSNKIKIRTGENTNVKQEANVINFEPLKTADREDDKGWDVMEFYGESDAEESEYQPTKHLSPKELDKVLKQAKSGKIGQKILGVMLEAS